MAGFGVQKDKHKRLYLGGLFARKLDTLPSHKGESGSVHAPMLAPANLIVKRIVFGIVFLLLAAMLAFFVLARSGHIMPVIENAAADALQRVVPPELAANVGDTDVALIWPEGFGITYSNIALSDKSDGAQIMRADKLTIAIKASSFWSGTPVFGSVKIEGAYVDLNRENKKPAGIVKISDAHTAFEALFATITEKITPVLFQDGGINASISDLTLVLKPNQYSDRISVQTLSFDTGEQTAQLEGLLIIDEKQVPVTGNLNFPAAGLERPQAQRITLQAENMPLPWRRFQTLFSTVPEDRLRTTRHEAMRGDVTLELINNERRNDDVATVFVEPRDIKLKLAADDFIPLNGTVNFSADFEENALTLHEKPWKMGQNTFALGGRFRDLAGASTKNAYQFELIANEGVAQAADADVEPVDFAARARGALLFGQEAIRFNQLDIKSPSGDMTGSGEMDFGAAQPTAIFTILAENMNVEGIKQLWPAPIARNARRWTLENLRKGRVTQARFDIAEPLRRQVEGSDVELKGDTKFELDIEDARFDVVGDLPPVQNAKGRIKGGDSVITFTLNEGTVSVPNGQNVNVQNAILAMQLPDEKDGIVDARLDMDMSGSAGSIAQLVRFKPIEAQRFYKFDADGLSGAVNGRVNIDFKLNAGPNPPLPLWAVDFDIKNASSDAKIEGRQFVKMDGNIKIDTRRAAFDLKGNMDGLPADIDVVIPFANSGVKAKRNLAFNLGTNDRKKIAPGLEEILTGKTPIKVTGTGEAFDISSNLTSAKLELPWIGWAKGAGIKANAVFSLLQKNKNTTISNFKLSGDSFGASGNIEVDGTGLKRVRFPNAKLTRADNFSIDVKRTRSGFSIDVGGKSIDARALLRHIRAEARKTGGSNSSDAIDISANIGRVTGFHGEHLTNVKLKAAFRSSTLIALSLSGTTKSGFPVFIDLDGAGSGRTIKLEALGAGEFLRFADIYTNMRGGTLNVSLRGAGGQSMTGRADIRDFRVFNEPKLAQLVTSRAANSQSLEQAVNRQIDTREVKFQIASSELSFKPGRLDIAKAVARGPLAGFSIQGKVFDSKNQTRLTGTFLPAYGLNRLFAEIPILGALLGNGRDRGLIGVTFKLDGSFDSPQVTVNPLSVIAPGIFRSIFEFR